MAIFRQQPLWNAANPKVDSSAMACELAAQHKLSLGGTRRNELEFACCFLGELAVLGALRQIDIIDLSGEICQQGGRVLPCNGDDQCFDPRSIVILS